MTKHFCDGCREEIKDVNKFYCEVKAQMVIDPKIMGLKKQPGMEAIQKDHRELCKNCYIKALNAIGVKEL